MSQGFVLENVHWSALSPHVCVLCVDSPLSTSQRRSSQLFCLNCVLHALNATSELAVSKRTLFSTAVEVGQIDTPQSFTFLSSYGLQSPCSGQALTFSSSPQLITNHYDTFCCFEGHLEVLGALTCFAFLGSPLFVLSSPPWSWQMCANLTNMVSPLVRFEFCRKWKCAARARGVAGAVGEN